MLGLVVTPTTCCSSSIFFSEPVVSRGRERSSSQTATPAAESSASLSVISYSSVTGRVTGDLADLGQGGVGLCHHVVRGEPELLEEDLRGGAGAVVLDADRLARVAEDAVPAHPDAGLDGHARLDPARQDLLLVRRVLLVEPLLARHRHDPGRGALGLQALLRGEAVLHLGAGADEDHLRLAAGRLGQDVAALE